MLVNEYFDYTAIWDKGLTSLEANIHVAQVGMQSNRLPTP